MFNKFKTDKTNHCYYCDLCPGSKKLRDIEDEMRTHLVDEHKHVIEALNPDVFDNELHQDFLEIFIDE